MNQIKNNLLNKNNSQLIKYCKNRYFHASGVINNNAVSNGVFESDRECNPRTSQYYEEEAKLRHYYYVIDTRGSVFLEETLPRNIATNLKDITFLNFLTKNMKYNNSNINSNIPYISRCGREINFITLVDRLCSIVYKEIDYSSLVLKYGGNLEEFFHPELLYYNSINGRIYHKVINHRHLKNSYGLLHPHICQELSSSIIIDDSDKYIFEWKDKFYNLTTVQ